jgi:hypothetical protein
MSEVVKKNQSGFENEFEMSTFFAFRLLHPKKMLVKFTKYSLNTHQFHKFSTLPIVLSEALEKFSILNVYTRPD